MTALTEAPVPIRVEGVRKEYPGGVQALRGVSFRIAAGERACLLGPNGAGKTTLIRLLTGALRPGAGQVQVWGAGVDEEGFLAARRRMGIVPQQPGMYRDLTVAEHLALVRRLYGRGDVQAVVEGFGLGPFLSRRMAELSGGWQRRLCLAAAVLPSPDILLLDEPTAGLDPIAVREVHAYLKTMMQGRTVLLCTHDLDEAEALCQSAIILRRGDVLLHERIDVLRQRVSPTVRLSAAEGPERLLQALQALGRSGVQEGGSVRVAVARVEEEVPPLLRALLQTGLSVWGCEPVTPTLEELFVDIVEGREGGSHAGA